MQQLIFSEAQKLAGRNANTQREHIDKEYSKRIEDFTNQLRAEHPTAGWKTADKRGKGVDSFLLDPKVQTKIVEETKRAEADRFKWLNNVNQEFRIKLWCLVMFLNCNFIKFFNKGSELAYDHYEDGLCEEVIIKPQFFSEYWTLYANCDGVMEWDIARYNFAFDEDKNLICFDFYDIEHQIKMCLIGYNMWLVSDYFVKHIKSTNQKMQNKLWEIAEECMRKSLFDTMEYDESKNQHGNCDKKGECGKSSRNHWKQFRHPFRCAFGSRCTHPDVNHRTLFAHPTPESGYILWQKVCCEQGCINDTVAHLTNFQHKI